LELPESGRVVVIDDDLNEVETLLKVLSQHRVAFTYFTGNIEELPDKPFSDVRFVFLDVVLGKEGITPRDEKTVISTLIGVVNRIIDKDNGPFILVLWTKHRRYKEIVSNELRKVGYCPIVKDLEKSEFFDSNNRLMDDKEMFRKLKSSFKEILENYGIFELFILWENIVHNSASATINSLSHFIPFNDKWNDEMSKIFYKLAEAWAGDTLDASNTDEIVRNSLFTLGEVFKDALDKEVRNANPSYGGSLQGEAINEEIKAKIHSRLWLDITAAEDLYPGNVYEKPKDETFKEIIRGISNQKDEEKLKAIEDASKFVYVEVTPICDFINKCKLKRSRFILGILLPITKVAEKHVKFKKHALFLYKTHPFYYDNEICILALDFRYFSSTSPDKIKQERPIFRLRREILMDIQTKLSWHIMRHGVLNL